MIKKISHTLKITLFTLLLVITQYSSATVTTGENIWQLIRDINYQTDTIQTLVNSMGGNCVTVIRQVDVASGIYTINQPGLYCIGENLTSTFNPAIRITSENVVLDLNNFTVTSSATVNLSIQASNIIVKNGSLKNGTRTIETTSAKSNISILNVTCLGGLVNFSSFNNNLYFNNSSFVNSTINVGAGNNGLDLNVIFKDCNFYSSSISPNGQGTNSDLILTNCQLNQSLVRYSDGGNAQLMYVDNCVANNTPLHIGGTQKATIVKNSYLLGNVNGTYNTALYILDGGSIYLCQNIVSGASTGTQNGIYLRSLGGITLGASVEECIVVGCSGNGYQSNSANARFINNLSHRNTPNYNIQGGTGVIQIAPVVATTYWTNVANA